MEKSAVLDLVTNDLLPAWKKERDCLDRVDRWMRWDHDNPSAPRRATKEYKELAARSQTPWGDFLVSSLARTLFVEGYRSADAEDNGSPWRIWQANGLDGHQVPIHRSVIGYGTAYGLALPGTSPLTGESMPKLRGFSPREMIALYEDPADDEWAYAAMRVAVIRKRAELRVYDDQLIHTIDMPDGLKGDKLEYRDAVEHNVGVCPVVRYTNRMDLEGRVTGEVEPYIPLLGRLDQTTFDRLVVQRFASWIVRTVAGMVIPDDANVEQEKLRLAAESILVAADKDTKFGSMPATPPNGFIDSHDADVRTLSAVAAAPAHEMLGTMANLSAEALAAARAPQTAKSDEAKHTIGEKHEQWLRLGAHIAGDEAAAADFSSRVRWKDTEIRSLAQAADALGKIATMLGFPAELLWEKIPGMEQQDVERARLIVERNGGVAGLQAQLEQQSSQPAPAAA